MLHNLRLFHKIKPALSSSGLPECSIPRDTVQGNISAASIVCALMSGSCNDDQRSTVLCFLYTSGVSHTTVWKFSSAISVISWVFFNLDLLMQCCFAIHSSWLETYALVCYDNFRSGLNASSHWFNHLSFGCPAVCSSVQWQLFDPVGSLVCPSVQWQSFDLVESLGGYSWHVPIKRASLINR
jgi:hypothetical protein